MAKSEERWFTFAALLPLSFSVGLLVLTLLLRVPYFLEWLAPMPVGQRYAACGVIAAIVSVVTAFMGSKHPIALLHFAGGLFLAGAAAAVLLSTNTALWNAIDQTVNLNALQLGTGLASLAFALFAVHAYVKREDN